MMHNTSQICHRGGLQRSSFLSHTSSLLDFSVSYLDLGLRVVLDQVLQLAAQHRGRHGVLWRKSGNQTTAIWFRGNL